MASDPAFGDGPGQAGSAAPILWVTDAISLKGTKVLTSREGVSRKTAMQRCDEV